MRKSWLPIRKLYRPLRWVWRGVVGALLITLVGRWLAGGLFEDKGFALQPAVLDSLRIYGPWVLLVLLVLAGLTLLARRDERRHKAFTSFDLLKPANQLRPEDLDFRVLEAGEEQLAQNKRPLYEYSYIPRIAVPYEQRANKNPRELTEEDMLGELRQNKGFVLQGPPLDGKSHTLYEIVRRMEGYEVLRPKRKPVSDEEDFSLLLKGRRVVLLLDDLTQYVSSGLDLYEFGQRLGRYAPDWVTVSTCRDGPELGTVKEATGNGLKRFYDDVPQKFKLLELAPEEKGQLAESIGKRLNPKYSEQYPTPGSITMEESIRFMKNRFADLNLEQRDILRALQLLAYAGVLPFTQERIQAVLEHIFKRSPSHLSDCLYELADQAFLRPGSQEPVEPEPAYLRDAMNYTDGKDPEDDFAKLADVLEEQNDYEGLFYLGTTYGLNLAAYEQALACFEEALRLNPDYPEAWHNKGLVLANLANAYKWRIRGDPVENLKQAIHHYQEALKAFEEALKLNPKLPEPWAGKAVILANLGDYQKALEAFEEALRLNLHDSNLWYNKGLALYNLGEHHKALEAYNEALRLNPDYPEAWLGKGLALAVLERYDEAVKWLCRAWRAWEDLPDNRAVVAEMLRELGRDPKECEEDPSPA